MNLKNATAVAEDVMFKNYLLFHKALKDVADDFDFEDVRLQRQMLTFILCIHLIITEREEANHPIPHAKSLEIYEAMKYLRINYGKAVVYNYISKLINMGVLEKVAEKSKIGRAQMFVFTRLGDYLIQHVKREFATSLLDEYDFGADKSLKM